MCIRPLLTIFVTIGLHVSLCTGGIFALGTTVADYLAYNESQSSPMSYGSIGYLSCEDNKRTPSSTVGVHVRNCTNTDSCFSQTNFIHEERALPFFVGIFHMLIPVAHANAYEADTEKQLCQLARAGPLYEQALHSVHSLIKLE